MQPVDHLQMRVEIDALERRHPRLENLDPADRAIIAALPRRFLAQFPGGADAADEDQTGIAGLRHVDGHLALAQLLLSDHRFSDPILTFASLRSGHFCECQNQRTANEYKFLVEFWIWHSLDEPAARWVANVKSTP